MTFAMILDVVVVLLLVPTIIFAVILNNRLSVLRKNREELGRLIAAFNDATVRAESGIPRLKRTSEESSKALQEKVEKAQMLRDDLAFMIERAEQMAGRLENVARDARDLPRQDLRTEGRAEGRADERGAGRPAVARPSGLAPLPHGLDIESAAEAAERAAMELARAAQEAELGLSEWAPGERRPEDRARAEKLHSERSEQAAPARGGLLAQQRPLGGRPGDERNAPSRALSDPGPFAADVGSAEHALAERILKEQAATLQSSGRADQTAGRAGRDAARAPERAPERLMERPVERQPLDRGPDRMADRPVERPEAGRQRPRDDGMGGVGLPGPAPASVAPRNGGRSSGKLLGAALADEPARTTNRAVAPTRKAPSAAGVGGDDDERSEAERELLRALRSVR